MSDLREKRVELILQQMEELPTLPAVAVRVLDATGREDANVKDVVRLIESDPALTARILQLVHRAEVGVSGDVASVERAVILLGFEAVRSAVLAVSVFEAFREPGQRLGAYFRRDEFWKHCIAVACAAELLAQRLPRDVGVDPGEAFVCGLLHDLGKVALDAMLPKSFSRVVEAADMLRGNIADLERTVIGLDHMVVGKRLAEKWQLPATVRDCMWLHGQLPAALPPGVKNPKLVNLITLADVLVREHHLGYSGNFSFPVARQVLCDAVGVSREAVESVLHHLVEAIEPRARALGLGTTSSRELYQQALAQANKELGRVTGQLATKNRKLATRAKFFDALSAFQGELRPDAAPQVVLHAIGQTAVSVLGVKNAAVFSLPPGRGYAETVLVDESGQIFETSLVECTTQDVIMTRAGVANATSAGNADAKTQATAAPIAKDQTMSVAPGDGPVLAAGEEIEWFLAAISPRLAHDHRYWMCLQVDGLCIGGVVWGAPVGEAQRLSPQVHELTAMAGGWSLALRTTQIREEARSLAEQLAEANRRLQTAQTELLRSRTVVTVGEMAAGAAHEMNNPLAVISGRSQLLAAQLEDPKLKQSARQIHEQSQRLSDIITELMDFAKPTPPKIATFDVAELIDKALYEAKATTDPADRLIEVTVADVPQVQVDADQVTAALTEVIGNALQATDEKSGQIDIHGAFDPYSSRVVITIADNGNGMDDTTLKRAFDPFFSAKPAGRRRGMGLPKALRWVESSGGSIRLESRQGQGTRTIVLLPAVPGAASAAAAPKQSQSRETA
jgi:putative nucleotidyltransferase with HDIG domain